MAIQHFERLETQMFEQAKVKVKQAQGQGQASQGHGQAGLIKAN